MTSRDILIVGCGLSGVVIAEKFASVLNKKVLIIDKRDHIGGNCYDYYDTQTNILINKYGAHLFHTNSERVWEYVNSFDKWIRWDHEVYSMVENSYVLEGCGEDFFKNMKSHTPHMGVWITCFVAFLQHDESVRNFLDLWYLQTLKYTTQDQIGFPYVCQKTKLIPYTLPNNEIHGDRPHNNTMFYIKHNHGQ